MFTHSPKKLNKFKQTLSGRKLMANCFLEQERSADGDIYETGDHNNFTNVLRNTKKCVGLAIRYTMRGMPTFGAVLLHDNARPHTDARTRALLEHFNWELFDRLRYSPDLALSDYHLFIYLKKWFGSQSFNNNMKLMEGVKK
jgi:hypothetical protein